MERLLRIGWKKGLGIFLLGSALCFPQAGFAGKASHIPKQVPGAKVEVKSKVFVVTFKTAALEMTGMRKSLKLPRVPEEKEMFFPKIPQEETPFRGTQPASQPNTSMTGAFSPKTSTER